MLKCNNCQIELKNKNQKKFCSRSCAAKRNNTLFPKKEPALTAKCKTIDCTAIVKSKSRAYCSSCIQNKKHIRGLESSESTIEELVKRTGSNRYDRIRINAHNLYKEEKKKINLESDALRKQLADLEAKFVAIERERDLTLSQLSKQQNKLARICKVRPKPKYC